MTPEISNSCRMIALEGAHNVRDLGGYRTLDGRQVAWARVYRAASLSELENEDHDILRRLGLRLICDLRSTQERQGRPSRLPPKLCTVWSRDHHSSAADIFRAITASGAVPADARAAMIALYQDLPEEQSGSFAEIFRSLARGQLPLLFHCAAGKDRTGVMAALLLDLLGVDRQTVIEDYVLTDQTFDRLRAMMARDPMTSAMSVLQSEMWDPVMRADPDYLIAMFDVLHKRHGGVEGYVRTTLGLDAADVDAIRDALLT